MNIKIPRNNNFDLLRLVFAITVVLVHMHDLSLSPKLRFLTNYLSSKVAIDGFFIISGFLIFMSYENSYSLKEYFSKRIRRIYPAYFIVIVASTLLGILLTQVPLNQYFSSGFIKYLFANLLFLNMLQPDLPGVFLNNTVMPAVNGALWTIKIEVMFYCSVPILVYLLRRNNKILLISIIYAASYFYVLSCDHLFEITGNSLYIQLAKQLPGQLSYFISGTLLYYFFDVFRLYSCRILGLGVVGFALSSYISMLSFVKPISLAIIVIYIAFCFPEMRFIKRYGDLSYGTYLYHFPVIQTFTTLGYFKVYPYISLFSILLIVGLLAISSWEFLEKPFLNKSFRSKLAFQKTD